LRVVAARVGVRYKFVGREGHRSAELESDGRLAPRAPMALFFVAPGALIVDHLSQFRDPIIMSPLFIRDLDRDAVPLAFRQDEPEFVEANVLVSAVLGCHPAPKLEPPGHFIRIFMVVP